MDFPNPRQRPEALAPFAALRHLVYVLFALAHRPETVVVRSRMVMG